MNKNNILLSGLLASALAILLFETGTLRLNQNTFQAQDGMADVVLENSGERAVITAGSHIFVESGTGNSLAGNLVGIQDGVVFIKEYNSDEALPFAISDVGRLVYGEQKALKKYIFKGLKNGAIGGIAVGTALWLLIITNESSVSPIEAYPFCVGFVSMFTVPTGALGGLINGAIKQGKAIEYLIGPNDWQLVQE
ncbi:hypothetical protein OAP60_00650 [bacterium]|nr:hypothetical protein [Candidatus Neomarinimicrobiota bacterium]MDC0645839.1 hypothetical protein [bacterium]MDC1038238.1 hypothetical protein [Candidatus Neomarinimicrobiota bacterium]